MSSERLKQLIRDAVRDWYSIAPKWRTMERLNQELDRAADIYTEESEREVGA